MVPIGQNDGSKSPLFPCCLAIRRGVIAVSLLPAAGVGVEIAWIHCTGTTPPAVVAFSFAITAGCLFLIAALLPLLPNAWFAPIPNARRRCAAMLLVFAVIMSVGAISQYRDTPQFRINTNTWHLWP